jgi:RHS repeat-associated protein
MPCGAGKWWTSCGPEVWGLYRDEADPLQCGAAGVQAPEIDHQESRAGDDGFLARAGAAFGSGAEDGGELLEAPPAGVPFFEPPDGLDEHGADAFVADAVDAAELLLFAAGAFAGTAADEASGLSAVLETLPVHDFGINLGLGGSAETFGKNGWCWFSCLVVGVVWGRNGCGAGCLGLAGWHLFRSRGGRRRRRIDELFESCHALLKAHNDLAMRCEHGDEPVLASCFEIGFQPWPDAGFPPAFGHGEPVVIPEEAASMGFETVARLNALAALAAVGAALLFFRQGYAHGTQGFGVAALVVVPESAGELAGIAAVSLALAVEVFWRNNEAGSSGGFQIAVELPAESAGFLRRMDGGVAFSEPLYQSEPGGARMLAEIDRVAATDDDGSSGRGQFDIEPEGDDGPLSHVLKGLAQCALARYGGCVFEFVVFHDGLVVVWVIASQSRRSLADSSPPDQAIMASNAPRVASGPALRDPCPSGSLAAGCLARLARLRPACRRESFAHLAKSGLGASNRHLPRDKRVSRLHALSMRWVLMLFVILAALMGGEARAVVVTGREVVSERCGKAEMVEKRAEALRVESERAFPEVEEVAGLEGAGPLALWFPGGLAVARSDCGDRQAVFSGGTLSLLLARGVDIGGGTRGLLWTARRETVSAETGSTVTLRFNRYNSRGDVVGQSDAAGVTTWAATYQADGRRTGEIGTNLNPKQATGRVRELGVNRDRHRANCLPKATQNAASGLVLYAAFAAGRSKEEDPTGLLNEGFRYRDMETGTFISRDPLGHVDGPNVYCYVGQNPWTLWDPRGLTADEMEVEQHEDETIGVYYRDNPRLGTGRSKTRERVGTLMADGFVDLGNGRKTSMAAIRDEIDSGGTDITKFRSDKSRTLSIDGENDGFGGAILGVDARIFEGVYGPEQFDQDLNLLHAAKQLSEVAVAQYIPGLAVAPALARELQFANAVRVLARTERGAAAAKSAEIIAPSVDDIVRANQSFASGRTLTGEVDTVLANMAYREGLYDKTATAIRDIAGRHLFQDGNKRTAQAIAEQMMKANGDAATPAQIRSVIDQVGQGGLKSIEEISAALRGAN